jgi:asparagine synthase (glutamine-hydrolysing)
MCGIVALRQLDGRPVDTATVERMAQRLGHRGPDDAGAFIEDGVGMGFRRLAILDLTPSGHQPMVSADGAATLIFNGEIFNYVELRDELQRLGHRFRSTGDAEVLLQAYLQWGTECLPRLNGEWAFVVYDRRSGALFGARDRFGIKPLYRVRLPGAIVWASEIKALLAHPDSRPAINWRTAGAYLSRGRLDYSTESFFEGIDAVPAGGAFSVDREGRERTWRYWSIPSEGETALPVDPARTFADLLEDAVRIRLRSDVPVGVCLSGGLDSTAVICAMDRLRRANGNGAQPVAAFTYHHPDFDERRYVDATVARTGAELHRLEMDQRELWGLAERVVRAHDEPVHTLTAMVGYELMRLIAGQGIRVILNGQGADETLAGYDSYFPDAWYTDMRRGRVGQAWDSIRAYTAAHGGHALSRFVATARRTVQVELDRARWYRRLARSRRRRTAERNGWFTGVALGEVESLPAFEPVDLTSMLRRSTTVEPLPLYLRIEDRNSMAHSVEVRLPLLDYRLVELAFSLEDDWKVRGGWNKFVLREAMRERMPEAVRTRTDKMGFPAPTAQLLNGGAFDALYALVSTQRARERGVYAWDRMIGDLQAHRGAQHAELSWRFFRVAQLELWAGQHGL